MPTRAPLDESGQELEEEEPTEEPIEITVAPNEATEQPAEATEQPSDEDEEPDYGWATRGPLGGGEEVSGDEDYNPMWPTRPPMRPRPLLPWRRQ